MGSRSWPQAAATFAQRGYTTINVEKNDDGGTGQQGNNTYVYFFPSNDVSTWKNVTIHNVVISGVAGSGSMATAALTFWRSINGSATIADANFEPVHQVMFKDDQPILPSHPVVVDLAESDFIVMTFGSGAAISASSIEAADANDGGFAGRTVNVAFSWEKLPTTSL